MISSFTGKSNTIGMEASLKVTCKEVSQYDRKGKWIWTYPSMMQASRETGIAHSGIGNVVSELEPRRFLLAPGQEKKMGPEKIPGRSKAFI
jgi:hypothetical protein